MREKYETEKNIKKYIYFIGDLMANQFVHSDGLNIYIIYIYIYMLWIFLLQD